MTDVKMRRVETLLEMLHEALDEQCPNDGGARVRVATDIGCDAEALKARCEARGWHVVLTARTVDEEGRNYALDIEFDV